MKIFKIALSIMIAMVISGCGKKSLNDKNKEKLTREEVKQEMLDYVNKKYSMEFECESISYADWYNPGEEYMNAYPKGKKVNKPEDTFLVKRFNYKGKVKITDGYVGYLNYSKYNELSTNIIKKYFPDAIGEMPFFFNQLYPQTLKETSTFDTFKEYTDASLRISHTIYVGSNEDLNKIEEKINNLKNELSVVYPIGDLSVFCYQDIYFKNEILTGNVDLEETDPDSNTTLIKRNIRWGKIDQNNPLDYYNVEEQE